MTTKSDEPEKKPEELQKAEPKRVRLNILPEDQAEQEPGSLRKHPTVPHEVFEDHQE